MDTKYVLLVNFGVGMKQVLATFALLLALPSTAVAFDTAAYCRQVGAFVGGSYQIELTCRQQENAARLNRMSVPNRIESYCREVGSFAGGSYQIMVTCIEQELEARRQLR